MANRWSTQFFATLEKKPFQLACKFKVDPADSAGYGQSSLTGPGIAKVYMNTSASPAVTGLNPLAGYVMVVFQDNWNRYLFGSANFHAPLSGTPINISTGSSLTLGTPYVITSVGTSSTANWNTVGVPVGITPAVGVGFIATATSGTGTGQVQASLVAGIDNMELVGDPNLTLTSAAATVMGVTSGAYLLFKCTKNGALATPSTGTYIHMSFFLSNSIIRVQGQ